MEVGGIVWLTVTDLFQKATGMQMFCEILTHTLTRNGSCVQGCFPDRVSVVELISHFTHAVEHTPFGSIYPLKSYSPSFHWQELYFFV